MKLNILVLLGCAVIGVALGSLAPFVAMVGSNRVLFKLIAETWRRYLFVEGWWPWPTVIGAIFALAYIALVRLRR